MVLSPAAHLQGLMLLLTEESDAVKLELFRNYKLDASERWQKTADFQLFIAKLKGACERFFK